MMQALNGTIPGATLSVGIIRGGDRTNVVPDYAYFDMDVRATDQASHEALEAAMRQVTYQNKLQGYTHHAQRQHALPAIRTQQTQRPPRRTGQSSWTANSA